jgi:hypothetical protein
VGVVSASAVLVTDVEGTTDGAIVVLGCLVVVVTVCPTTSIAICGLLLMTPSNPTPDPVSAVVGGLSTDPAVVGWGCTVFVGVVLSIVVFIILAAVVPTPSSFGVPGVVGVEVVLGVFERLIVGVAVPPVVWGVPIVVVGVVPVAKDLEGVALSAVFKLLVVNVTPSSWGTPGLVGCITLVLPVLVDVVLPTPVANEVPLLDVDVLTLLAAEPLGVVGVVLALYVVEGVVCCDCDLDVAEGVGVVVICLVPLLDAIPPSRDVDRLVGSLAEVVYPADSVSTLLGLEML